MEELFFEVLPVSRSRYHESWGTSFATFRATFGHSLSLDPSDIHRYLTDINMLNVDPSAEIKDAPISTSFPIYIENLGRVRGVYFVSIPGSSHSVSNQLVRKYPFQP